MLQFQKVAWKKTSEKSFQDVLKLQQLAPKKKPQVAVQDPATKELHFSDLSGNVLVEASVTHFGSIFFFNTLSRFEFD